MANLQGFGGWTITQTEGYEQTLKIEKNLQRIHQ